MAAIIREELESERKWDELFASKESQDLLARLGDKALEEHRQGRTRPLEELLQEFGPKRSRPPKRAKRASQLRRAKRKKSA